MGSSSSSSKSYRFVTAAIGLLFAFLAIAIIVVSDRTVGPLFVALVLGSLGIEAIASAFRIYGPQAPVFDGTWKLKNIAEVR